MKQMNIISVRDHPESLQMFIDYFSKCWASKDTKPIYQNCIENSLNESFSLPQWYLLLDESGLIIGGTGLVTNDFISRMDLLPWLCALHVQETHRNKGYGTLLVDHACDEGRRLGFMKMYLSTEHTGYYERLEFTYIGKGYHPWGACSRIYERNL